MNSTHDLILAFLFCSVVFFSFGFLAVAFYINRQATKSEREAADRSSKPHAR